VEDIIFVRLHLYYNNVGFPYRTFRVCHRKE